MNLRDTFSAELVAALERLVDERVAAALARREEGAGSRWLTVAEAAEYLRCSERAVYARIRKGRIPAEAVRHSGRRVYLDRLALDRALERAL